MFSTGDGDGTDVVGTGGGYSVQADPREKRTHQICLVGSFARLSANCGRLAEDFTSTFLGVDSTRRHENMAEIC